MLISQSCPHRSHGYVDSFTEPWKNAGAEAVCFVGKSAANACADQPLPSLGYLAPELQKRSEPVRALVKPCHSIDREPVGAALGFSYVMYAFQQGRR